ncbi:MAG: N-acetylglucosamine-6-phosphate deacetylase [Vampirovibrionales bacterium]
MAFSMPPVSSSSSDTPQGTSPFSSVQAQSSLLEGTQWIFYHVWYLPPSSSDTQMSQEVFRKGSVLVKGQTIHSVHEADVPLYVLLKLLPHARVIQLPDTLVLSPGLIEQHCHGGFGCDVMSGQLQTLHHFLRLLPSLGITGVLPTLITAPEEKMLSALNALEEVAHLSQQHRARMLGIHLEGPFLNPQYRGAHPETALQPCSLSRMQRLLSPSVKLVTLAPELPGAIELIKFLVQKGIRVSIGHTNATSVQTQQALEAGATCFTHAFNAMRALHHRTPGVLHTLLMNEVAYHEMIGDGVHLHPETMALLLKSRPRKKQLLVSDCMCLSGLPEDETHTFGGELVGFKEGAMRQLQTGTIVGSALFVSQQIPLLVRQGLVTFELALRMASEFIANHLGCHTKVGSITQGLFADLVLWDRQTLNPMSTWVNGICVIGQEHWLPYAQTAQQQQDALHRDMPQGLVKGFSSMTSLSVSAATTSIPTQAPSMYTLPTQKQEIAHQPRMKVSEEESITLAQASHHTPKAPPLPKKTEELASQLEALVDFEF